MRFPKYTYNINLLMAEDPEFPALCEDYQACVDALQYWARSADPIAETRVAEYRTLIQELEDEIHQAFAAMKLRQID
ncbi:MAG: hypothetical protein AMJ54_12240 [Deltaproteobacteria bacterium SG8_13]|nr:MAG: hypothetical protein AMJ54_12240 [Deltaproteobacteria bacterium SG8_13]